MYACNGGFGSCYSLLMKPWFQAPASTAVCHGRCESCLFVIFRRGDDREVARLQGFCYHVPVQVRTNTKTHRETYRDDGIKSARPEFWGATSGPNRCHSASHLTTRYACTPSPYSASHAGVAHVCNACMTCSSRLDRSRVSTLDRG